MIIKKISYSITRQISAFHPTNFSIEADLVEGETPEEASKILQTLAIRILYRDKAAERDALIKTLITDTTTAPADKQPEIKKPIDKKEAVQEKKENGLPDF